LELPVEKGGGMTGGCGLKEFFVFVNDASPMAADVRSIAKK
jgi:hypothetical protein